MTPSAEPSESDDAPCVRTLAAQLEDEIAMMDQARERLAYISANWRRIADGDDLDDPEQTIERDIGSVIEDLDTTDARTVLRAMRVEPGEAEEV